MSTACSESIVTCVACNQKIEQAEMEYAQDFSAHPGVLGPVHASCYSHATTEDPDLPWTDPISGEVDYEAMQEDLGVDCGDNDDDYGDDYY